MCLVTIKAPTAADLFHKIYKREGWTRVAGESRTRRIKQKYTLAIDHKARKFVATIKTDCLGGPLT
jgi:hypothetical protein